MAKKKPKRRATSSMTNQELAERLRQIAKESLPGDQIFAVDRFVIRLAAKRLEAVDNLADRALFKGAYGPPKGQGPWP